MKKLLTLIIIIQANLLIGMQQDVIEIKEKLEIKSSVKLPNGDFVCLVYDPLKAMIRQQTAFTPNADFPLNKFITAAPIMDVSPKGFVTVSNKLIATALATVFTQHDHALFLKLENPILDLFTKFSFSTNNQIRDITMARTSRGDLLATLLTQKNSEITECNVLFEGETLNIKRVYMDKIAKLEAIEPLELFPRQNS